MASSYHQRSPDPTTTIHAVPKVVEIIIVDEESVAENASEFHRVLSTPPQRKEKGKKRGLDDLSEKTELSNQPAKKRKCRPKVADDKFSLKTKKAKVTISKPVKVRSVSPKKDSQSKRKYVREKKQQPNVAVSPTEATYDAVGRDVVVSEETLLGSAEGEVFKEACRRALFNDENLTHMSIITAQVLNVAPEPPSPEDGKLGEKAIQPPLFGEEKGRNHEAEERYIFSDDLLNLAEPKDSRGASRETLDYKEVNTVSATVDMSDSYTDMDFKDLGSLRLERDSLKKDDSTLVVYVRKRKTQPSINIQHNFTCVEATSVEEVRVNENESRARTVHDGSAFYLAGRENFASSRRKGLNSGVVNDMSISHTNKNKTRAVSSSDSKNDDRLAILHIPLISNGRNMLACPCIQLMRKCKLNKFKIKKQRRMLRKRRVDVSRLLSFQTPKQLTSKEPILISQKVSLPTRRQRSKGVTRRREFFPLLYGPPFNKSAIRTLEQQPSVQVPETDIWPTHDNLVTTSKGTAPSQEEKDCVRNQNVYHTQEPQSKVFDPIFTINEHLFVRDMPDDSGYASQNCVSMQNDSALEPGLDCSSMNAVSFPYSNLNSLGPWTYDDVPVHNNVYSADNFYPFQKSVPMPKDYSVSVGAGFQSIGQPPLLDPTFHNNQLLSPVPCVTNEQETNGEARGGLWTTDDPNHQNLLYNNQLQDSHRESGPTFEADSYYVNSHLLVPYCEPSKLIHGQELPSRVDNSIDVINDTGNQALVASEKKKKVIPHVNFDSKTMPMWRALMGLGDSCDHQCNEDEESKKWWREERRVFKEKVQAFISCMHMIQGNRRFSQWKGSILDSVMGVFLTQNVSDHLSSSAYMSLAAKYPVHTQKVSPEECEGVATSQESCGSNEVIFTSELSHHESLNDKTLDGEQVALDSVRTDSRNEFAENNPVKDDIGIPIVGLSGFEEWLSLQEQMNRPQDSSHPKSERKDCISQQEQNTPPQNPSHANSEIEELLSQQEYTAQPHYSSHSDSEFTEHLSRPREQMTESQNSFHPNSETQEWLSHLPDQMTHLQDSSRPKSETDELPSHQQEQRKQHQNSTHPKVQKSKTPEIDWLKIKTKYCQEKRERSEGHTDSVDWDAVRRAPTEEVADAIKKRGQHNILAASMQNALHRIFSELGSLDLEWLRDTPPDVTKDFLLSIDGLGLKSVECIRLLALEQVAFPVDTNVGRIAVRLGWVDLKDVPEGLQFHLLEQYPLMDAIQKYLWPRLCELDQLTLYELHYQMITFGKIFCKKRSPYCNACPLRASCKYFASAFVSACLPIDDSVSANAGTSQSLPLLGHGGTQSQSQSQTTNHEPIVEMPPSPGMHGFHTSLESDIEMPISPQPHTDMPISPQPYTEMSVSPQPYPEMPTSPQPYLEIPPSPHPYIEIPTKPQPYIEMHTPVEHHLKSFNPIVELPRTPKSEHGVVIRDIEDLYTDVPGIPTIVLNNEEFVENVSKYIDEKKIQNNAEISNAVVVSAQAARIPARKLKNIKDLRTEHLVYEIPDNHPLLSLHGLGERDPNDPCFYLLSIWSPDETVTLSSETVKENSDRVSEKLSIEEKCSENCTGQQHDVDVYGTFMIPCRTAMQGRFPLNGTYFQVNEVFADDESSHHPVKIPRSYLWDLKQRIVYCGSSASAIATGLTTKEIQVCFWRDYLCVRGFNRRTREPKELVERLHKLKTTTQTKRSSRTGQRILKKNKMGSQ